jgi:hypothetical protein
MLNLVGSFSPAGTLTRVGQAFDELPMIATINALLFTTMELQTGQVGSAFLFFLCLKEIVTICSSTICGAADPWRWHLCRCLWFSVSATFAFLRSA